MIIFSTKSNRLKTPVHTLPNIERVDSMKVLGVLITDNLSMNQHINSVCESAAGSLFAIKLVHSRGLNLQSTSSLTTALVIPKLTYASTAWWGFAGVSDRNRLQTVLNKAKRWGLYDTQAPTIDEITTIRDKKLILTILINPTHVLHPFLPPIKTCRYDLRQRAHNRTLPIKENPQTAKNFVCRSLYEL